jgi:hypothetical protein
VHLGSADSPFFQQRLKAWQPILTPKWVIISFCVVALVFIPIGFVLVAASDSVCAHFCVVPVCPGAVRPECVARCGCVFGSPPPHVWPLGASSQSCPPPPPSPRWWASFSWLRLCVVSPTPFDVVQVVEYKVQYDGTGADPNTQCSIAKDVQPLSPPGFNCTISIHVKETMSPPVYVYYELDNFYQNHRRYVKSRSDAQLKGGNNFPNAATTDCDPLKKAANGKLLWPCGLIANSMFNGMSVVVGCYACNCALLLRAHTWTVDSPTPHTSRLLSRTRDHFLQIPSI